MGRVRHPISILEIGDCIVCITHKSSSGGYRTNYVYKIKEVDTNAYTYSTELDSDGYQDNGWSFGNFRSATKEESIAYNIKQFPYDTNDLKGSLLEEVQHLIIIENLREELSKKEITQQRIKGLSISKH